MSAADIDGPFGVGSCEGQCGFADSECAAGPRQVASHHARAGAAAPTSNAMTRIDNRFTTFSISRRLWQNLAVHVSQEDSLMPRQRAIVIGGSMSGLVAARVLADHFAEVVLFDRDAFPQPARTAKGCRKDNTRTRCCRRACQTLEQLFPGLQRRAVQARAL